jgi:hypothetical protein
VVNQGFIARYREAFSRYICGRSRDSPSRDPHGAKFRALRTIHMKGLDPLGKCETWTASVSTLTGTFVNCVVQTSLWREAETTLKLEANPSA